MCVVTVASGLFLIILGAQLFTSRMGWLSQWLPLFEPSKDVDRVISHPPNGGCKDEPDIAGRRATSVIR
jgi:hypothetical protein